MFRNRAVQMRFVKAEEGDALQIPDFPKIELPSKEDVKDVTDEVIKNTAVAVIAVIGAAALARTISEIVIHHATK